MRLICAEQLKLDLKKAIEENHKEQKVLIDNDFETLIDDADGVLSLDAAFHEVYEAIDRNIYWQDYRPFGIDDDYHDFYYAEDELYIIRDRTTHDLYFVKAKSPYKAFEKFIERIIDERFKRGYPKPVRHGKWVGGDGKPKMDGFSVYCSSCGKWSEYRTRYCGECGAKMDEE